MAKWDHTVMVIEPQDVECVYKFWDNFGFKMSDSLKDALENFKADPTIVTQRELRKQLTIATTAIKDEALAELFKPVLEACHEKAVEMQFEDDIDEMLQVDPDEEGYNK